MWKEKGAMLVVTLIILTVVTMLGMSAMETAGLELRMSGNSRDNQAAFEAAEYTLSWVQQEYADSIFDNTPLQTGSECGAICFEESCPDGYCFDGENPGSVENCKLNAPEQEFFAASSLWEENSGRQQALTVSNTGITSHYFIEFRCYTALDPSQTMDEYNYTRLFRITAFATGAGGRGGAMLRSMVAGNGERIAWEILEIPF